MAEYSISAVLDGAGFQLSTILVGISCLYYTYIVNKRRNLQNKLFIMMLVNIVVTALCSLTASFLSPVVKGPGFAFNIYRLTQYVYFVVHPLLAPMFCFYVAIITGATRRMKSSHRFIYQSPMYLIILMALVNPFTHWIYDYTETYAYCRGNGIYVLYAVSTIYFAAAIVILFFFWDAVTSRIRKVLFFFVVLIAIGTVIQLVIDGVHTELICEALALTAIMFSVESEETRRDVNTGLLNSLAMSQDLRRALKSGQPFHMICIKMQNPLNLMQLIGQANIAKLTAMTGGFLTTLTEDETLYYVGPGTFVIRREGTDEEEDLQLARKIAARFRQPWDFQGRNNVFNAVVLFVRIPEDVIDMGDIMMLMNAPMPRGFVPTEDVCRGVGLDNILRQSRLEKNILEGLRNQSFEVFYQPIYTSRNMSICAGEALLRLHDAEAGEIYPDEFLPVAERGGLIFELGDFVLEEVCKFLNSGIPVEMGIDCFHINLSVVQCIQQNYAEHIMEVVSKYQIDPARIDFEIMESAAAADLNALQAFVRKLRSYGFSFSVNDYGIGYSHVHSIFHLDIDTVKIDKSILREAESSETGRIIMESSVEMIKRMGKKIIISGVENQSQVDLANEFAIDYLQGFFFSNPVSQNEFINVLKASRLARMEEQKAIASNEAMSSFLANMSHEIRTPINAVLGMDEMILRESKDEKVLGYAKTIESAGRTLLSLINDVLDFSKIESGKMDILCAEYDLGQVLLDVMAMVRVKAKEKNLGLHLDADPELYCDLMGDEVRLRQVLLNLLNNAVKYTKTGSVTLKVRGHKQKDETLKLEISVKDTGIGIRPEDQEKLFEKFSRLDIDKNKTVEGTGLGLAITSQILSLMEGEIRVESTYGKGSEFIVTLDQEIAGPDRLGDMTQREKKLEKYKQKPRAFRAPAARILVVDDTSLNHVVVRELLSDTEITIDTTDSGQGALEMVRRDPYDLILLDYRMPGMNGIETIHAMKELPGMVSPEAPVVALTANAVFGAKERFIREGFTDYITKPVSGERLEEVLLSYLPDEKIEWIDEKESGSREEDTAAGEEISTGASDGPVDVETGIRNCGNRESYIKVLKVFMTDVESKSKLLRESFDKKDWERYGIEVHAIKSSGRIIGATQLSQKAQELEHAAEEADEAFIGENHEAFLSLYEGICGREELRELCGCHKGDDKPALTEEAFREALEAMHDFCLNMDEKNADYILSSLRDYTLSKEQEGKVAKIEELLMHLEWEQLRSLLEDKI